MNVLIVVDVQNDFLRGSLRVPLGEEVVFPIVNMAHNFDLVIATRDFHPGNHCSFKDFGGEWPSHCVRGTPGAALHPRIDDMADIIISKGTEADREAYSGFQGTILGDILAGLHPVDVTVVGLATDYCVKATALDAGRFANTVTVDLKACRGITEKTVEEAIYEMEHWGVKINA